MNHETTPSIADINEDPHLDITGRLFTGFFGAVYSAAYPFVWVCSKLMDKSIQRFYPHQYDPEFFRENLADYSLLTLGCLRTTVTGDLTHVWKYSRRRR